MIVTEESPPGEALLIGCQACGALPGDPNGVAAIDLNRRRTRLGFRDRIARFQAVPKTALRKEREV